MEGILFGNKHSYLDYGLILTKKSIGNPEPKKQEVDVHGAHGKINLTKYLDEEIKYSNRALRFEYETIMRQDDFMDLFSKITNDLHGKELKIILDIDKEYYYIGEISVNPWESNKVIGKIVIDVDAQPFKMKHEKTIYSSVFKGRLIVDLLNMKKWVIPTFTLSNRANIIFENTIYYNIEGSGEIEDIVFRDGFNRIIVESTEETTLTISYQEGGL